jgi:hypothetical protein
MSRFFSGCRECERIVIRDGLVMPAAGKAAIDAGAERLLDDRGDGPRTTATFGAATETAINLLGIPGKLVRIGDGMPDVVVAQDVTGTNNHEKTAVLPWSGGIDIEVQRAMQKEKRPFEGIPNCGKTVQFIQDCLIAVNQAP